MLSALGGAALVWTLHAAASNLAAEVSPARWRTIETSVPLVGSAVPGQLRPNANRLDLAVGSGVSPKTPPIDAFEMSFDATVPDGGLLSIRWGDQVDRLMPQRPTGLDGTQNHSFVDIEAMAGTLLSIDRGPHNTVTLRGFGGCTPITAPKADFHLDLSLNATEFKARFDGQPAMSCRRPPDTRVGNIVLSSGVRRIELDNFRLSSGDFHLEDSFGGPLRHPLMGLLLAGLGALAGARLRSRGLALALLPALAGPFMGFVGTRAALDGWRLVAMPEGAGPLLFSALPALLLALPPLTARLRFLPGLLAGISLGGLLLAFVALSGAPLKSWLMLASIAPVLSTIAWVNTHPVRARPWISLALSALVVVLGEGGLRWADRMGRWTVTAGWVRATEEFTELIEIRKYRSFPDKGFPIQPPEPDPSHRRIFAFGGSSTGGAFNLDNLDMFWPTRLGSLLRDTDWQVVNQGVGGWNTLHIRLYLESQIERLDPDIVVLYVGHNDLGEAPMPYSALYANWRGRQMAGASDRLSQLRLYNGLRFGLLALMRHGGAVAVPLGDARDNLEAIAQVANDHGAKVLFLTEGLNPDPAPMEGYALMQQEVASHHEARAANAAAALYEASNPDFFLDDCHLTVMGHNFLARYVKDQLDGWL